MSSPAPVHYLQVPGTDKILGAAQDMKLEICLLKLRKPAFLQPIS